MDAKDVEECLRELPNYLKHDRVVAMEEMVWTAALKMKESFSRRN